jgi:putative heme-binding domain-containing protein
MTVGSDDTLTVWLNGKKVYDSNDSRSFLHEHARFDVELTAGTNPILVKCGNHGGDWQFAVAVTTAAEYAFLKGPATAGFDPEAFRAYASKEGGEPENGRALFSDLKGLACIKCHAVGGQGGAVGPELSSVGAKYPRDELIAAVLYPSAKIAMGFEPIVVAASDGRLLTGIVKSDTPEALEIEDAEARRIRIPAADIEERKRSEVSIMPSGLAEGLTQEGFADLIAYLETLKEIDPKAAVGGGRTGGGSAKSALDPAGR